MATGTIKNKLVTKAITIAGSSGVTVTTANPGSYTCLVSGTIAIVSIELIVASAISAYGTIATGFPTPQNGVCYIIGADSSGTIFPLYIDSTGKLLTRKAISANTTVRFNACYVIA